MRTVISTTVTLAQAGAPLISLEDASELGATLVITSTDPSAHDEVQVSATTELRRSFFAQCGEK